MTGNVSLNKRMMKRPTRSGGINVLLRYVVSYRDPKSGERVQKFFERQKEAQAAQNKIQTDIKSGFYADRRDVPTVEEAFDHWIEDRRGQVKERTLDGYQSFRPYIVGSIYTNAKGRRTPLSKEGKLPEGGSQRSMLGKIKITELSTAEIRTWHKFLYDAIGAHTANRSQSYLKTLLFLAAEDYNVRPPVMPRRVGRGKQKQKKAILTPEQVRTFLKQAREDSDYGIYYAFPFLTGVRPSEQLGLLWGDVDFEKRTINICRMQEKKGEITNLTKTTAGNRVLPISSLLYDMLLDWRDRCPRKDDQPNRVFPNIGFRRFKPEPRKGGGYCLLYANFRKRVWHVALKKAGLPAVTPHSARHAFISTLQAQGIEVGLVAKLAGHANAVITLSHYTQAIRGGEEAIEALGRAFNPAPAKEAVASAAVT